MATLVVTNTNASGTGSLAAAVQTANATAAADTIVFAKALTGQTINLSGDLLLTNKVSISGDTNKDGDADITINTSAGRIFNHIGNTATLNSVTLTGGDQATGNYYNDSASSVINNGTLRLNYVNVANNTTFSANVGMGTGAGTIVNTGKLSISQSGFSSNSNEADFGSNSLYSYDGRAGGSAGTIVNRGTLTLDKVGFFSNSATGGQGGDGKSYFLSNGAYGGYYRGGNGGDGGNAGGAIFNTGTVSGTYDAEGNTASGGTGGAGGAGTYGNGPDGAAGLTWDGVLSFGGGTSDLVLTNTGTMADDMESSAPHSHFAGLGGGDTIFAYGDSVIDGGAGADTIVIDSATFPGPYGGPYRVGSIVKGGLGNDTVVAKLAGYGGSYDGGGGRDTIDFSNDTFSGQSLDLGAPVFSLYATSITGFENVIGSKGDNLIIGGTSANILNGWTGNDTIEGGKGADKLDGGADIDTLSFEHSQSGVTVNLGLNTVSGGDATGDKIQNFENVTGSGLADILKGDAGGNDLNGGAGKDTLNGAGGNDHLAGGSGHDTLTGGNGLDTFILAAKDTSSDVITDFNSADDQLWIAAAEFGGGLVAGTTLGAGMFVSNTTGLAGDGNDRFIYNTATGELFFDDNGDTTGGSRLIATFTSNPALSNLDFVIV